jgi:hypothetical protein
MGACGAGSSAAGCGEARDAEAEGKADAEVNGVLERSPVSRECL